MITLTNISLNFTGQNLFSHVDMKFTVGNCYGIIGANGAGKSTFLRILSGDLAPSSGSVTLDPKIRMSVLKQDHFAYNDHTVIDTIMMGNPRLYEVMLEKDRLYAKEDFTEADGIAASELEGEFAEMGGWEAETEASRLLQGLGITDDILTQTVGEQTDSDKVKILLAQALFGHPDIILLDEPTNHLDAQAIRWLEDFLFDYAGTIIVVSHDRHFLNDVCTHIVDIDYGKVAMYVGNYDFWYQSSQMIARIQREQNKKNEDKIKELQNFIARFAANKSKSRQATSRKKLIDKLTVEEMPASSRRYPYVGFTMDREPGKEILTVTDLNKTIGGVPVLQNVSFRLNKGDKVAFLGKNEASATALFEILCGGLESDSGSFSWGISTSQSYLPKDNTAFFDGCPLNIIEWLGQYTREIGETYVRGFLGRMLFSGDDVYKPVTVLSGGEKVRCMLSRMMLFGSNVLVADQPTNHLDLEAITAVNDGLAQFKGNVLFASHDHEFMQTVANRIIAFTDDGIIDFPGSYEEFLERYPKVYAGS